jgi:Protein of unknown function (DUF3179)
VWETTVDGRPLHFELFGINNQNFIMRDRETGSWWQQVSGAAIHGPMRGKTLKRIAFEEVSYELWTREYPGGRVLLPDPEIIKKEAYAKADWEQRVAKLPTPGARNERDPLQPRDLVIGIELNGKAKAFPFFEISKHRAILSTINNVPLLILLAEDGVSVRAFETVIDGRRLDLYVKTNPPSSTFLDVTTGSEWNFEGKAISGPLAGRTLRRVAILRDYWFDWKNYHPDTAVYSR